MDTFVMIIRILAETAALAFGMAGLMALLLVGAAMTGAL